MPLETWVSIGALFTAALGLALFMRTMLVDLGGRIDRLEAKLDSTKSELMDGTSSVKSELMDGTSSLKSELGERIDRLDTKIDDVRADLGGRIDRLETRVATLDDRVYTLAVGMRPLLDRAEKTDSSGKATRTA